MPCSEKSKWMKEKKHSHSKRQIKIVFCVELRLKRAHAHDKDICWCCCLFFSLSLSLSRAYSTFFSIFVYCAQNLISLCAMVAVNRQRLYGKRTQFFEMIWSRPLQSSLFNISFCSITFSTYIYFACASQAFFFSFHSLPLLLVLLLASLPFHLTKE